VGKLPKSFKKRTRSMAIEMGLDPLKWRI